MKIQDAVSTRSRHDSFDIAGYWKFPKSEEHVAGRLSYDGHGELTLVITTFSTDQRSMFDVLVEDKPSDLTRATGVLETGERVVLEDLRPIRANVPIANYPRITMRAYIVTTMFAGNAIPATMQKFEGIRMDLVGLLEWMNQLAFKTKYALKQTDKTVIEHTPPQGCEIILDDDLTLKIEYSYRIPLHIIPTENFAMSQSCFVSLYTKTPLSLDDLHEKITKFGYLVMIVTKLHARPTSIKIKMNGEWLGVFGKYATYNATHHINYLKFPLYYTIISKDFETMVKNWFKLYDTHNEGLDLYFITRLQESQMSSEIRFLRAVQSLEALDRADHPKHCEPKTKTKLEDRIIRLLKIQHDILKPGTDKEKFSVRVAKIRNYYSHGFIEECKDAIPDGLTQHKMNLNLELLLYGYIFHKLSIPECLKEEVMAKEIESVREFERLNPSPDD